MTLPANWVTGQSFTAAAENAVETAVNAKMAFVGSSSSMVTSASTARPSVSGPVYWVCAPNITPTNAVAGDIVFNMFGATGAFHGHGVITPSAVAVVTPTYDNIGAGYSGTSLTPSFAHPVSGSMGGNYVVVAVSVIGTSPTCSGVNYGSTAMSLITSEPVYYTTLGYLYLYGVAATTSATVSATLAGTVSGVVINSVSYAHVISASAVTPVSGADATTITQTISCPTNNLVVQAFGIDYATSLSAISGGTNRYNSVGNDYGCLTMSDSSASSTTFTMTAAPTTFDYWAGAGAVLL